MTDYFYQSSPTEPLRTETHAIRPAPRPSAPVAAAPVERVGAMLRPFSNQQQNSRLAIPLPAGPWEVRWRATLAPDLHPRFIMQAGDRIVLQGASRWQLFTTAGEALAADALGASDVTLDPAHSLFYYADPAGTLNARRLSDGALAFRRMLFLGPQFRRVLLERLKQHALVVSVEHLRQPHGGPEPYRSLIELRELGNTSRNELSDLLISPEPAARLIRETTLMLAALRSERLVAATRGSISLIDPGTLRLVRELTGEFEPLSLSLDEAGGIYLLVREGERTSLWLVNEEGERLFAYALTPGARAGFIPPIVGDDHRVYLVTTEQVIALGAAGEPLWTRAIVGKPAGAVVTADGQLLLTAGPHLSVFDAAGRRTVLANFGDETLATPPGLTAPGELLVASERFLYCLTR